MDRAQTLDYLKGHALDILVVGGGIVGSGILRDAAMRTLRVGLVEQHDLVAGTSGLSSRLLHGGLRYLAQGRVGLVREASREKLTLSKIAPELCEPLAFVFPCYKRSGWPFWKLRMGVSVYDFLCGRGNLGRSTGMNTSDTLAHVPGLAAEGLTGSVRYYDALTSDTRLVLDTLRSAVMHKAGVATRCRLVRARREEGLWLCDIEDTMSGETFVIKSRAVVSAAGPWGKQMPNHRLDLRLTKGVHIVVPKQRLSVSDAVMLQEGKRILFAIPWG